MVRSGPVGAVNCEKIVAAPPDRFVELSQVVDRAVNRGRRAGDEAAVAQGTPRTLSRSYNRVSGTQFPDTFTTRIPDGRTVGVDGQPIVYTLSVVFGPNLAYILSVLQRPPADGSLTDADLVFGKAGDDLIDAGPGNDHLEGEKGDDTLLGAEGNDLLYGRTGADRLYGGAGVDLLEGGRGNDRLEGGSGSDGLNGGIGADRLSGGPGDDRLTSVDGTRDVLDCGSGRDVATVDSHDRVRGCERVIRPRTR